jgi:hypothetical protein
MAGAHTRQMGRHRDPRELVRRESRERFAFLVSEGRFAGPEETESGLVYDRPDLQLVVRYLGPYEPQVATSIRLKAGDEIVGWASLGCLYAAFGCGPLQDVPGSAAHLHRRGRPGGSPTAPVRVLSGVPTL